MAKIKFTLECEVDGSPEELIKAKAENFLTIQDNIREIFTNEGCTNIIISNFETKEEQTNG